MVLLKEDNTVVKQGNTPYTASLEEWGTFLGAIHPTYKFLKFLKKCKVKLYYFIN
jgi:hypothetical protein